MYILPVTKVPLISDYINGVINLRGKVIPTIDFFAKSPLKKQVITNPINTINVNELKRALELDRMVIGIVRIKLYSVLNRWIIIGFVHTCTERRGRWVIPTTGIIEPKRQCPNMI